MMLLILSAILPANALSNENILNLTSNVEPSLIVVWNNGMNYDGLGVSQWDELKDFDFYSADDFRFGEDTVICGARFICGYKAKNYQQASFEWAFQIYRDCGNGKAPGNPITEVIIRSQDMLNPILIEDTGKEIYYEFMVNFSEPIMLSAGEKYWGSAWSIGAIPPKAGFAYHYDPINLHQAVGKSVFMGYPSWQNLELISEIVDPVDGCFQLLTSSPPTTPDVSGPLTGKSGTSYDYSICSTDAAGDDISYCINWGDNSGEEWTDLCSSGEMITAAHTWNEDGSYSIQVKAKDIHGIDSDWATLEVSMPKNDQIICLLQHFIENHLDLFLHFQRLLT